MLKYLNLSNSDLIEIGDKLNHWKWDARLGEKPENWDGMLNYTLGEDHNIPTKRDIIRPYLEYIERHTTKKARIKYHHLNNCNMTIIQHEIWWIKDVFSKLFGLGFYSKKNKRLMGEILQGLADNHMHKDIIDKYGSKTSIKD